MYLYSFIAGANGQSLPPFAMIDTINDNTDLETIIDNEAMFHSDNDSIIQIANDTVLDVNISEHVTNIDQGSSASSEDESFSTQVCLPVNNETDDFNHSTNIDAILAPSDEIESNKNIDKMRQYLQTQCYEGSKWYHSLNFEGTLDKKTFSDIDIIQYIRESCFKDERIRSPIEYTLIQKLIP